jgi:hypothetical protein
VAVRRYRRDPPKQQALVDLSNDPARKGRITLTWSEWLSLSQKPSDATDVDGAYDPPSIGAGAALQVNIGAPGAHLGDFAVASHSAAGVGIAILARVSATDQVTVTLLNVTGGSIDLAAGTLRVRFWDHNP